MNSKQLESLKERLSKIPHLPFRRGVGPGQVLNEKSGTVCKIMVDDWSGMTKEDCDHLTDFIADAPTIIADLLAHIESNTVVELTSPPVFQRAKPD
jgi:hypothetical protein